MVTVQWIRERGLSGGRGDKIVKESRDKMSQRKMCTAGMTGNSEAERNKRRRGGKVDSPEEEKWRGKELMCMQVCN